MGNVDLVLGLIAGVVQQLRERAGEGCGEDPGRIPVGGLCDTLHAMQLKPEFQEDLQTLEFRRVGDSWISGALEDLLFLGGAWGLHTVPNPSLPTISVPEQRARKRLEALKRDFGQDAVDKLNRMASAVADKLQANELPQTT